MKTTPIYLDDKFMPVYKFILVFAFMLGSASILAGIGYGVFTYAQTELSFSSSMYAGLILFLKGAGISAMISFIGFLAFWNKHQIAYENCKNSNSKSCSEMGYFSFA